MILLFLVLVVVIRQFYVGFTTRPSDVAERLYDPDELLHVERDGQDGHAKVLQNQPFVILSGYSKTPVRLIFADLTRSLKTNSVVITLHLAAENMGYWTVAVFEKEDLWYLWAGNFAFSAVEVPELILQPRAYATAEVTFEISLLAKPTSIDWFRWTGAGWSPVYISLRLGE